MALIKTRFCFIRQNHPYEISKKVQPPQTSYHSHGCQNRALGAKSELSLEQLGLCRNICQLLLQLLPWSDAFDAW